MKTSSLPNGRSLSVGSVPAGRFFARVSRLPCFGAFTVLAFVANASPDSALKAYQKGDFNRAQAEFEKLAKQKPDDPRLRFNAGDAAYRRQDYTNASAHFESALGAPDLGLQERAYYNLGNVHYQLGTKAADPQAKLQAWQQSLTNFGSAVKLDGKDTNAAANLAFVQKQVEELMKQMPKQSRPQNGKDDKNQKSQDKDQNQSQQSQSQQSKDQQKPQDRQNKENGDEQSQQAQAQDKQSKDDKSQSQQAQEDQARDKQAGQPSAQPQQAQQKPGNAAGQKPEGEAGQPQGDESGKPGEMNAVQAARLLDEQKGDEKALVFQNGGGKDAAERRQRKRKTW